MSDALFPIGHASFGQHPAFWSALAGGALGCLLHCGGVCLLCLSGGAILGRASLETSRLIVGHLLPALFIFGVCVLFLNEGASFS